MNAFVSCKKSVDDYDDMKAAAKEVCDLKTIIVKATKTSNAVGITFAQLKSLYKSRYGKPLGHYMTDADLLKGELMKHYSFFTQMPFGQPTNKISFKVDSAAALAASSVTYVSRIPVTFDSLEAVLQQIRDIMIYFAPKVLKVDCLSRAYRILYQKELSQILKSFRMMKFTTALQELLPEIEHFYHNKERYIQYIGCQTQNDFPAATFIELGKVHFIFLILL